MGVSGHLSTAYVFPVGGMGLLFFARAETAEYGKRKEAMVSTFFPIDGSPRRLGFIFFGLGSLFSSWRVVFI